MLRDNNWEGVAISTIRDKCRDRENTVLDGKPMPYVATILEPYTQIDPNYEDKDECRALIEIFLRRFTELLEILLYEEKERQDEINRLAKPNPYRQKRFDIEITNMRLQLGVDLLEFVRIVQDCVGDLITSFKSYDEVQNALVI